MNRPLAWIALPLLLAACDARPRLAGAAASFRVDSEALSFPATYPGVARTASVSITGTGRGAVRVRLGTAAPFEVADSEVELSPGETRAVELRFRPGALGVAKGLLRLTSSSGEAGVQLSGEVSAIPTCAPSSDCVESRFDLALGRCVEVVAADGQSCGANDLCVSGGRCVAGRCVGERVSCDDGNRCTADVCHPKTGCAHPDTSASCATFTDPCLVGRCDPAQGCVVEPVQDGTSCGAADCSGANVCLAGACQFRANPDAERCAQSPCPAGAALSPAWSYRPQTGKKVSFHGLSDRDAHLFWVECDEAAGCGSSSCVSPAEPKAACGRCELVSVDREGNHRFRVALNAVPFFTDEAEGTVMISGDVVLVVSPNAIAEARSRFDGALLWSRSLGGDARVHFPSGEELEALAFAAFPALDAQGDLYVPVALRHGCPSAQAGGAVVKVSAQTGALIWRSFLDGELLGAVADEAGQLHLDLQGADVIRRRVLAPQNGWTFTETESPGRAIAAQAGRVLNLAGWQTEIGDAGAGQVQVTLPFARTSAIFGPARGFVVSDDIAYGSLSTLHAVDVPSGNVAWAQQLAMSGMPAVPTTEPLLTSANDVLIAAPEPTTLAHSVLRGFDSADGGERFACPLPGPGLFQGPSTLLPGRWVGFSALVPDDGDAGTLRIEAFEVPGVSLAPSGWVGGRGGPERGNRPR